MISALLRQNENNIAIKAGVLSLGVHMLLVGVLVFSLSWNTQEPVQISQVELWDALPTAEKAPPKVVVKPEPPKPEPEPKPEPKVEPEPKPEPKPEPAPEPKADIQVKKEKVIEKKEEKPKKDEKPKAEEKKVDDKAEKAKEAEKKREAELKKLQAMLAAEDEADAESAAANEAKEAANKAASAANASEVNKYKGLISNKIKSRVNKQLCGDGKPELTFVINLLPTGELSATPKFVKGSGIAACDEAVERAIIESQPLPLPENKELFTQFRSLQLKFRPNDD